MAHVSLTLLVLKTRQVEQLRLFYQTLGVELAKEQHGKGPVHFAGRAGDVVIEVYPLPDDAEGRNQPPRISHKEVWKLGASPGTRRQGGCGGPVRGHPLLLRPHRADAEYT